jgi:hypothetical protein
LGPSSRRWIQELDLTDQKLDIDRRRTIIEARMEELEKEKANSSIFVRADIP